MVALISAAAPTEEEDEEVYFALTQMGIYNKIMDSPPGPQKRRRHPTKKAISPKIAFTLKQRTIIEVRSVKFGKFHQENLNKARRSLSRQ
jgi:hypothetical protein